MAMPMLQRGITISPPCGCFFVYTVLDVGSMIAIYCGAMQMGIVGSGAVCYQCMRALLSLCGLSSPSPEFIRPFR